MLFKRRKKRPVYAKVREFVWPSMGFGRTRAYLRHRILRLKDSPHSIAAGLALGVAISFSPLIGTHFIQCLIIALAFRVNVLASFFGTVVGNPTTFPFIWGISYALGRYILGLFGIEHLAHAPGQALPLSGLWESFDSFSHIFWPWMLGGYILALVSFFPSYFLFKSLISGARLAQVKAKETLLQHKVHKVAKEVTGQKE